MHTVYVRDNEAPLIPLSCSSLVEVVRQLGHRLMAVHAQNLSTKITLSSKYQSTRLFASIQSILSVIGSRVLETACTGMTAKNKRLLYRLLLIKTLRTCLFFPALKAAQQCKARTPYWLDGSRYLMVVAAIIPVKNQHHRLRTNKPSHLPELIGLKIRRRHFFCQ